MSVTPLSYRRLSCRSFYSCASLLNAEPVSTEKTVARTTQTLLYFDNIFPIKYGRFDPRWLYSHQLTMMFNWDRVRGKKSVSRNGRISPEPAQDSLDVIKRQQAVERSQPVKRDWTWWERFNLTHVLPEELLKAPDFRVSKVVLCEREGGLFLKCYHSGTPEQILEPLTTHLEKFTHVSWFNLQKVKAYRVYGTPFLDDMRAVHPSSRVRITFTTAGSELTVEQVYAACRPYGEIVDISFPPPGTVKDAPKYCFVQFSRVRAAARIKCCLHNAQLPLTDDGTGKRSAVSITYEPRVGAQTIWNWLSGHPRVVISVGLALVTGLSYLVWDPIRMFFITNKITDRFSLEWTNLLGSATQSVVKLQEHARQNYSSNGAPLEKSKSPLSQTEGIDASDVKAAVTPEQLEAKLITANSEIDSGYQNSANSVVPGDSAELEQSPDQTLRSMFLESPTTFSLVTGPHGSGKSKIVDDALRGKKYKLVIDCEELVNAPDDHRLLEKLAKDVGFFPSFTTFQNLNYWIETVVAGTTGVKASLSSNTTSTFGKMLETTAAALGRITEKQLKEVSKAAMKGRVGDVASAEEPEVEYPVVVIRNFMNKEKTKHQFVFEALAQWAAYLVENKLAHVVFLSTSQSASRFLSKSAAGNRSAQNITLSDASLDSAYAFMHRVLGSKLVQSDEMKEILGSLGGRLTDLESFAHRVNNGMSPKEAYNDLLLRSIGEIRKVAFEMDDAALVPGGTKVEWTLPQLWTLVKVLSNRDTVEFDRIKFSAHFGGNDAPLRALESCHLLSIVHHNGRPCLIKPGKPLYQAAFKSMVEDEVLAASLEVQAIKSLIDAENASIAKYESELSTLQPWVALLKARPVVSHSSSKWYKPLSWIWSRGSDDVATPVNYPNEYSSETVIAESLALAIQHRLTFLGQQLQASVRKVRQLSQQQQEAKEKIQLV